MGIQDSNEERDPLFNTSISGTSDALMVQFDREITRQTWLKY